MAGHTLRDVATHAGVSKATASRVLNGSVRGGPETRHRGARPMARLSTRPASGATAEPRPDPDDQRRHIVPDSAAGRGAPAWRRRGARRQRVRPGHLQRRDDREARPVPARASHSPSGPMDCSSSRCRSAPEDVERLSSAAIPVVVIDAHGPAVEGLPHVVGDDIAGGELATKHLLELGHRRVGVPGRRVREPFRLHLEPTPVHGVRARARERRPHAACRARRAGGP